MIVLTILYTYRIPKTNFKIENPNFCSFRMIYRVTSYLNSFLNKSDFANFRFFTVVYSGDRKISNVFWLDDYTTYSGLPLYFLILLSNESAEIWKITKTITIF